MSNGVTEPEGFVIEAALDVGFEMIDDDGDVFKCTQAQVLEFAERLKRPPIAALTRAAKTFRWYAELHRAKGDDPANIEKVRRNEEEALNCERALR